jgi:hypothetical protein
LSGGVDEREIGVAIATARWGSDSNEDHVSIANCLTKPYAEGKPTLSYVGPDEFVQSRLEDWNLTTLKGFDFGDVLINAHNMMTEIGKACSRDKAYITCTKYCDTH